ncbi:MAG: chloride channel protein [Promethearchaeia archaeon]
MKEIEDRDLSEVNSFWFKRFILIFLIATILGVICGFFMVFFNYTIIFFQLGFSYIPYFIGPMIAGILTGLLVKITKIDRILGTGAAEFVSQINLDEEYLRREPILFGKFLTTSWTYSSGMVCGREGPGLLIGANLGYILAKRLNIQDLNDKDFYFIGASACTSAILKIPISGALFCAELPYNDYIRYRSLIPSIIASFIAYLIFCSFFDFHPLIKVDLPHINPDEISYLLLFPLLITFGIISGLFVRIFVFVLQLFMKHSQKFFQNYSKKWLLPISGALGYCIFLLIVIPFIESDFKNALIGPSAPFISFLAMSIKEFNWEILFLILILFLIAIFFSIGTLNSAGIIMPLMILGALIGAVFGVIFYPENPELFVLIGIAAVLGASINNPITAIIILIEMTWVPFLFVPAAISTVIAYIVSGSNAIIPGQRFIKEID